MSQMIANIDIVAVILIYVAITAIVSSIIVQLTKNTKYLDKFPTELETIIVNVVIGMVIFFGVWSYKGYGLTWYLIVGVFILTLISAFVCMEGWDSLVTIINKFAVPKDLRNLGQTVKDIISENDNDTDNGEPSKDEDTDEVKD